VQTTGTAGGYDYERGVEAESGNCGVIFAPGDAKAFRFVRSIYKCRFLLPLI